MSPSPVGGQIHFRRPQDGEGNALLAQIPIQRGDLASCSWSRASSSPPAIFSPCV